MNRVVVAFGLVALWMTGCGPMSQPLPERLSDEAQQDIDTHWNQALTPVEKHDRETWLDALVVSRAYQAGVDSLDFRSEKKWAGGRVVMEIHFDRTKPADDRFEITVLDHAGQVLRRERYDREEMERVIAELNAKELPPKGAEPDPPEIAAQRAAQEARKKRIEAVFPKPAKKDQWEVELEAD